MKIQATKLLPGILTVVLGLTPAFSLHSQAQDSALHAVATEIASGYPRSALTLVGVMSSCGSLSRIDDLCADGSVTSAGRQKLELSASVLAAALGTTVTLDHAASSRTTRTAALGGTLPAARSCKGNAGAITVFLITPARSADSGRAWNVILDVLSVPSEDVECQAHGELVEYSVHIDAVTGRNVVSGPALVLTGHGARRGGR